MSEFLKQAWIFISTTDYQSLFVLILIGVLGGVFYRINKSKETKFNFDDLLLDSTGKSSSSQVAIIVSLVLSSWAFVHLTLTNHLTEWFFMGYMGVWVLNKGINKWQDTK